ncbi:MAG: pitrilysin family protein, partial [Bacteroidales bacterium]
MMKKIWILCMALAVFTLSFAQKGEVDLKQPLPIDKNVRVGTLSNGLKYYIRKNAKPENRVMLQLATNAGSINENDAQVGLAHFCEHMLFNGTKNFPKSELINFLQKTGMRFGGDINAYTSFDQTVYMLEIPTDQVGLLDKGLQVLEDWAHQASFDSSAIDEERGIIIEEWRMGLGAQDRMRKKILPIIVNNSLYAKRLPIGTIENLKTFKHETIRKFYKDFYRPNLQAVVVV